MSKSLPQPTLWQSLQFGDKNAFVDFLGQHALWHVAMDHTIRAGLGAPFPSLPLGDGPIDDGDDWHAAHQAMHEGEASGLALAGPPDFTAYDLNKRDDFATWTWLHALEHVRTGTAAGI